MSGLSDKFQGKAKQAAGKLTGDKKMELEGKAEQVKGQAKDKADEVREHSDESSERRDR